jgi:hypothetical protein
MGEVAVETVIGVLSNCTGIEDNDVSLLTLCRGHEPGLL